MFPPTPRSSEDPVADGEVIFGPRFCPPPKKCSETISFWCGQSIFVPITARVTVPSYVWRTDLRPRSTNPTAAKSVARPMRPPVLMPGTGDAAATASTLRKL